jgi:hypothetical protein
MSGGIRRWATAARLLGDTDHTLVLENGGFVQGASAQDVLKADALAETLGSFPHNAVNLTGSEAKLGFGRIDEISRLSGSPVISTALTANSTLKVDPFRQFGPALVGGAVANPSVFRALGQDALTDEQAASELVAEAQSRKLIPVLMLSGSEEEAEKIAGEDPDIALIVFSSLADPPGTPKRVGSTWLVTPGENGKFLVTLSLVGSQFSGYTKVQLDPAVKDDPLVSRIYSGYLRRIDGLNLIDQTVRQPGQPYSGSERCGSCHREALAAWHASAHSHALATLEKEGHGHDPDCVRCHVTGLAMTTGFRSRAATPALGVVGCESCHGAGENHSRTPNAVHMRKIDRRSCIGCHSIENSPTFDFLTYWARIKHR